LTSQVPVNVLIVDDDDDYARYVEAVFGRTPQPALKLVHVRYLRDVLPVLADQPISVMLLDVYLPDGDGLQWLRDNRAEIRAAVVVLTGSAEVIDTSDVATLAQAFLVKSELEPAQLVRIIRHASRREQARQEEEAARAREEKLRQARRMESVGRLAGGIAHDFSNLLTVVTGASERLRDRFGDHPGAQQDLDTILRNCMRGAALTRQLLAFSRQQTLSPQRIDLGQLVEATGTLLEQLIGEHIQLELDIPPGVRPVEADRSQIEQVLMNLAINARDAMADGGVLRVAVSNMTVARQFAETHPPMVPGEFVVLQVVDTGHGMTEEVKSHAFEPFFTTKDPSQGTGLGLATVYGIVNQSGGYIWIDSEPGAGTTFTVFLPPTERAAAEPAPSPAPVRASVHGATILLTEDEDEVRDLLHDMLETQGFKVIAAGTGAEALAQARTFEGPIDLLLTDVVMPGGTGRDLATRLTAERPDTRVLYISGYPEHGSRPGSVLEAGSPFLPKPFTRDQLLDKIRQILA
jgi:signal transduction histidine kinase